jgi:hypothetical protein
MVLNLSLSMRAQRSNLTDQGHSDRDCCVVSCLAMTVVSSLGMPPS